MTDFDRAILQFEGRWWQLAGNKEGAIGEQFGLSAVRYYQLLNRLLDDPDALAFDAHLVTRLRRIRSARADRRAGGRHGEHPSR